MAHRLGTPVLDNPWYFESFFQRYFFTSFLNVFNNGRTSNVLPSLEKAGYIQRRSWKQSLLNCIAQSNISTGNGLWHFALCYKLYYYNFDVIKGFLKFPQFQFHQSHGSWILDTFCVQKSAYLTYLGEKTVALWYSVSVSYKNKNFSSIYKENCVFSHLSLLFKHSSTNMKPQRNTHSSMQVTISKPSIQGSLWATEPWRRVTVSCFSLGWR